MGRPYDCAYSPVVRRHRIQRDAPFIEPPRHGTARGALHVLAHGACYVGLLIFSIVLYLPMRLVGFAAVILVLCEVGMAWTDWRVRHHPGGAVLTLLTIPLILFATGALVRFRTWLIEARRRWS
jgi:hypothetical protein